MRKKPKQEKARPEKTPLSKRVTDGIDTIGLLGRTAVNEPRELPRHAEGLFRRWFKNVWAVRGGGLYAVGFAATFLYLETVEIVTDDIPGLFAINPFSSELIEYAVSFVVDTFMNFVAALMWPYYVATFAPPWGAVGLGIAFAFFSRFCQPAVERWLERDDDIPAGGTGKPDQVPPSD
ncbi:MAG: hypothetical protein AAGE85_04735 [Pseudomonadota bacterium]